MRNFRPRPTHIPNTVKVGHTVPEICSGQKKKTRTADAARRTDMITKSLPELSSGETKNETNVDNFEILVGYNSPLNIQKFMCLW